MKQTFKRDQWGRGARASNLIAFVHHKGGTGKTTSCINIAGWLAKMGKQVLVVDLDPQGDATAGLGIDRSTLDISLYDVLQGKRVMEEVIVQAASGVHVAPSSLNLLSTEMAMAGKADLISILAQELKAIERYYDYILIDVPPGSTALMMNGIAAAEHLIIPIDSGVFGYEALETLKSLILDLGDELGVEVNVRMVLLRDISGSMFDWGITRQVRKLVSNFLQSNGLPDVKICTIPYSRQIYKSQIRGLPISHSAPHSNVGRAYRRIAAGLLDNSYEKVNA